MYRRQRQHDCDFFHEGNVLCMLDYKFNLVQSESQNATADTDTSSGCYQCNQCSVRCQSLKKLEDHYLMHRNMCSVCKQSFLSPFLLDTHIQELHDSYFSVLAERQSMYRCLVDSCMQMFQDNKTRNKHLVTVHKFPKSFDFHKSVNVKKKKHYRKKTKVCKYYMQSSCNFGDKCRFIHPDDTAMDTTDSVEQLTASMDKFSFGRKSRRR